MFEWRVIDHQQFLFFILRHDSLIHSHKPKKCKVRGNHASFHGFPTIGNISSFCVFFTFPSFLYIVQVSTSVYVTLKENAFNGPSYHFCDEFHHHRLNESMLQPWSSLCSKLYLFGLRNLRKCNTFKINRLSSFLLKQSFIVLYIVILDGFLRW